MEHTRSVVWGRGDVSVMLTLGGRCTALGMLMAPAASSCGHGCQLLLGLADDPPHPLVLLLSCVYLSSQDLLPLPHGHLMPADSQGRSHMPDVPYR